MNADDKIIARLTELIERGLDIENTKIPPPPRHTSFDSTATAQAANQWHASSKNILAKAFGRDSEHFQLFEACFKSDVTRFHLHKGIGILKAAKEDFEHGYLQDVRNLVAAEMFSDLLQQANELLDAGYHCPAAVLAGAVLEDNLRKLCGTYSIELPDKPKLDFMNTQLAKANVFNKLTQKRITAIADIRNSAAHGKCDEFQRDDVEDMIKWITGFIESHLG